MWMGDAADADEYGSAYADNFDAFAGDCAYSGDGEDHGGLATRGSNESRQGLYGGK